MVNKLITVWTDKFFERLNNAYQTTPKLERSSDYFKYVLEKPSRSVRFAIGNFLLRVKPNHFYYEEIENIKFNTYETTTDNGL